MERGGDPWRPYDFAVAEANRRGLDVEADAPGAAVLDGGRATLVAADNLIVHENAGSPFDQAFLVLHEIAHAELGDDPEGERARSKSIRRAPPSLRRSASIASSTTAGGSGARSRWTCSRANSCFPPGRAGAASRRRNDGFGDRCKRWARRSRWSRSSCSTRSSCRRSSLPRTRAHADKPLNKEQAEAAAHRGEAYMLEAGPGTGKTQTLTARVESLLDDGVDPRRILVLTFSNKAAGEMAGRIARKRPRLPRRCGSARSTPSASTSSAVSMRSSGCRRTRG